MTTSTALKFAFRSGMSRRNDLQAAIDAKVPVGVVAGELVLMQELFVLPKYLKAGGSVFVDSGAFTAFKTGEAPDFDAVLRSYENIAEMTADMDVAPTGLYVVSPDAVGDQMETLRLIEKYKARLLALIDTGCNLVVPIQRGTIPAQDMLEAAKAILGTDQFVAGIPSNAEAMSVSECETFMHHTFHILGRVQMNDEQVARITALRKNQPDADVTADANWMRSRIDQICESTDRTRSAQYIAGTSIRNRSARTLALTEMLHADTKWAKRASSEPVQQSLF